MERGNTFFNSATENAVLSYLATDKAVKRGCTAFIAIN